MTDPWNPPGAHLGVVLLFFVILTVVLHAVFVYWLPLSKRSWKRVDYAWLALGTLGLIGAAAEVRKSTASFQLKLFQNQAARALKEVHEEAEYLSLNPGPTCRTFVRSEYSPPTEEFERIQREYNVVCNWAMMIAAALPRKISAPPSYIDTDSLPKRPAVSDTDLIQMSDGLYRQIESYNSLAKTVRDLAAVSQRDDLDWTLVLLSPFLLAVALAIRLTKVSGELRLDR